MNTNESENIITDNDDDFERELREVGDLPILNFDLDIPGLEHRCYIDGIKERIAALDDILELENDVEKIKQIKARIEELKILSKLTREQLERLQLLERGLQNRMLDDEQKAQIAKEISLLKGENKLEIGQPYQGGVIFYLDETRKHGLIAASHDQSTEAFWGWEEEIIFTKKDFGTGHENTKAMLASSKIKRDSGLAVCICANLNFTTRQDWFIPSLNELILMRTNLHFAGFGGFVNAAYWSSTQFDGYRAHIVNFGSKEDAVTIETIEFISHRLRLRVIHKF